MSSRFLSRPQTVLRADQGIERGGTALSRLVMGERAVISRGLCHFERMRTPAGRQSLRAVQAAALGARSRTPISDPAFYLDWRGDEIGVWSWSREHLAGLDDFEGECVPETVLHAPQPDGPALVRTLDGYEGQVWSDGVLQASRWWADRPGDADWRAFLRAARCEVADDGAPTPITPAPRASGASGPLFRRLASFQGFRPRDLAAAVLLVLAAPIAFLGAQSINLELNRQALERELAGMREATAEVSEARRESQAAATELRTYAAALDRRHPAEVLAAFTGAISEFGVTIGEFEVRNGQLSVAFLAPEAFAPDALVRDLEDDPLLSDVRLERGQRPRQWLVNADLELNS